MDHLDLLNAETDRFIAAVRQADGAAPVLSCPDWTADDLLWHLTEVHAYWAAILGTGAVTDQESEAVEAAKPSRPDDREATIALLVEGTAALISQLAARADEEPAYSWFPPDQTVGFTRRMQVHEATMHRVDAELAAGLPSAPISPEVAADGIAHGVEVMWGWWGTNPGFEFRPTSGIVELRASDGASWLVQPGRWGGTGQSGKEYDEPGAVLADEGNPAATVDGTVEELYRWLWGRGGEPAASGDDTALAALREARDQGMQ